MEKSAKHTLRKTKKWTDGQQGTENDESNESGSTIENGEVTLVVIGVKEAEALGSLLPQTLLLHMKDV